MYKFLKNHVSQIMGVLLSVLSLTYLYIFEFVMDKMFHTELNFLLYLVGGMLIIAGLIFFVSYCTPLLVITCKEKLCTDKKIAKILDHTDKGTKVEIENNIYTIPVRLKKKDNPVDSEIVVYTDRKEDNIYLPIPKQTIRCIIGMVVSMAFIVCSIFGLGAFVFYLL